MRVPSHPNRRLPPEHLPAFVEQLKALEQDSQWEVSETVSLDFEAGHPQGLVKIGDHFFLSTVEKGSWFRKGKGFLIKFDERGRLLERRELTDGSRYHPGGIDFDGESIWVSMAEYKPNSSTTVLKVDPGTLEASPAFEVADHIGAITRDPVSGSLFGATWDAEQVLEWSEDGELLSRQSNSQRSYNYQDWKFAGDGLIVGAGVRGGRGGLSLMDTETGHQVAKVPVRLESYDHRPMTQNPMTFRFDGESLKLFVVPDDGDAELFVLEPGTKSKVGETRSDG